MVRVYGSQQTHHPLDGPLLLHSYILLSIFILSLFYLYSTFNIHVLTTVSDNLRLYM